MKRGRSPKISGRKMSERAIIEAIEESPGTFTEVYNRVNMAKSTFNDSLKELEDKEEVERYYDKDRKATLIRLSEKMVTPVEKTLRHLENLTVRSILDLEKGRKLLDNGYVLDAITRISTVAWIDDPNKQWLSWSEYKHEGQKIDDPDHKRDMDSIKREFNEYKLVRALARYFTERYLISNFSYGEYEGFLLPEIIGSGNLFENEEKFQKFLNEKYGDKKAFPAIYAIEEIGIKEEFDELLLWLRPLLESEYLRKMQSHREELGLPPESDCPIIALDEDINLVSALFRRAVVWYIHYELGRAWGYYVKNQEIQEDGNSNAD